jgi:hypothetical protein
MKHATLALATAALLLVGAGQAKAQLIGSTVDVAWYYPDTQHLGQDFGQKVVNPTAMWVLLGNETTTITDNQIFYTSPSPAGQYATASFNGFIYDFRNSGNLIRTVTVDPSSTLSGFDPSTRLHLLSDGAGGQLVELDLGQGLFYSPRASVILDVNAVPEPSSFLTLLATGVTGLFGYSWRRRQTRV